MTRLVVGLLLWVLSAGSVQAQQTLVWKFVPGETFHYQLTQATKTSINLGVTASKKDRSDVTTEMNQTLDTVWHVKKVQEDGAALVELDITRMRMNVDGPGGQGLQYDSADETRPQGFAAMIGGLLKALTEATYQITMTPYGEITSVVLPESLLEQVRNAPGGELMGGLTSEAGFKNLMSQNTLLLPEQAELVPGHEWSNKKTFVFPALNGKQTIETTYRYEGTQQAEGNPLEVFNMQLVFDPRSSKIPGGATVRVLQQKSKGKMLFNRSAGRLESSAIELMLQIEINNGGQLIEQVIEQTVEMRWMEEGNDK